MCACKVKTPGNYNVHVQGRPQVMTMCACKVKTPGNYNVPVRGRAGTKATMLHMLRTESI